MSGRSDRPVPFFGPTEVEEESPRLLLISWHFPPSNSTGALRWQRFAPFAAERGWALDVITRDPGSMRATEWARMEELPAGTRVFGLAPRSSRSAGLTNAAWRVVRRLRRAGGGDASPPAGTAGAGEPASPDPGLTSRPQVRWDLGRVQGWKRVVASWSSVSEWAPWVTDAADLGTRIAAATRPRVVVSCGPPHAAHSAARRVSLRTGLPMVMDMRDPWSMARVFEAQGSPMMYRLWEKAERAAVERADLVVCNTEALAIAMRAAHPRSAATFLTVRNGCDDEEIQSRREERFVVAYAGNVYIDRDPRPLFAAAHRVVTDRGLDESDFGIELMGDVGMFGGVPVEQLAREAGIERFLRLHPPSPRQEALQFLAGASLLVSLPQSADLAIPSKIYEYMQFQAWTLVLATTGSATELLLRGSSVDVVEPTDVAGIAAVIDRRLDQHRAGVVPPRLASDPFFGRERQAAVLFDFLDRYLPSR